MPGATFALSAADIQRRFGEASVETRRQCQTLAAYDIERFNREILRVHTEQKATGFGYTRPEPTLALTLSSESKLTASPSQASRTELVSSASAGNTAASLTKARDPAAALLAHVTAAVVTTAKTESTASLITTFSVSNSVHMQKEDGGTTAANPDAK